MNELLYKIPANTPREEIIRQLQEHPEKTAQHAFLKGIDYLLLQDLEAAISSLSEAIQSLLLLTLLELWLLYVEVSPSRVVLLSLSLCLLRPLSVLRLRALRVLPLRWHRSLLSRPAS